MSKYRAKRKENQQEMTTFPTDGVKKTEWVSDVWNRCRDIIISNIHHLILASAEKDFSPQRRRETVDGKRE